MNIEEIKDPTFLKKLNRKELDALAQDIRKFLIQNISQTGGHLSSNLGVVELTIALHYVFDAPTDKIFFDVGHQSYTHKILTGRADEFTTLRKMNGLSGFQKRRESEYDVYEAGHSSTALSCAVGMAVARDLEKKKYDIVPVIGDAAIVGGPSLEALNHLGSMNSKVIIILNDNQMSISRNVGGINNVLSDIRTSASYNKAKADIKSLFNHIPGGDKLYKITKLLKDLLKDQLIDESIFTEFGVDYLGPIDGHDFKDLIRTLKKAKDMENSVVVHVVTKKGKGYEYAEKDVNGSWHSVPPFNIQTGEFLETKKEGYESWSSTIAAQIYKEMAFDQDVVTITPAMINGSCLETIFRDFPNRSYDVGIAEEHAATFACGLSVSGKKPFLTIYSSFMQRAYDQLNHDVARMDLPMLIAVDRAGLVGSDGETHHGVFDIGLLMALPNVVIFTPSNSKEAKQYINTAFYLHDHPYFIRVPKGMVKSENCLITEHIDIGTWERVIFNRSSKLVITYDKKVNEAKQLILEKGLHVDLVNARFFKPMDYRMLNEIIQLYDEIIVYETDLRNASLGLYILEYLTSHHYKGKFDHIAIGDHYTPQGTIEELEKLEKVDINTLYEHIK